MNIERSDEQELKRREEKDYPLTLTAKAHSRFYIIESVQVESAGLNPDNRRDVEVASQRLKLVKQRLREERTDEKRSSK
jgi:hypothetical protein